MIQYLVSTYRRKVAWIWSILIDTHIPVFDNLNNWYTISNNKFFLFMTVVNGADEWLMNTNYFIVNSWMTGHKKYRIGSIRLRHVSMTSSEWRSERKRLARILCRKWLNELTGFYVKQSINLMIIKCMYKYMQIKCTCTMQLHLQIYTIKLARRSC